MIKENYKQFWNIVKGIGIVSIVIGHCWMQLMPFVYLYHLAIFFFSSGYLYSEEKYGDDPYLYFLSKIKSNWKKYFFYSSILIILHNLFFGIGILHNSYGYSIPNIFNEMINASLFFCGESLGGPLWFVPVFIFASVLFGITVYYSRTIDKHFKKKNSKIDIKDLCIVSFSLLYALLFVVLVLSKSFVIHHLQTAFLVVPIFSMGYFTKKYLSLDSFLNIYAFIASFILLICFLYVFNFRIELSVNQISGYWFYLISAVGIYWCLCFAKILLKLKYCSKLFDLFGKYSFEIMAFHFLVFKIIDLVYANIKNIEIYSGFPTAFPELSIIYTILGSIVPMIIFYYFDKGIMKFNNIDKTDNKTDDKNTKKKSSKKNNLKKKSIKSINSNAFIKTLLFILLLGFSMMLFSVVFFENSVYKESNNLISFVVALVDLAIWFLLYRIIKKHLLNISKTTKIILTILFFILLVGIEIFVINTLSVKQGWDFGVIFDASVEYHKFNRITTDYFQMFPNNIILFCIQSVFLYLGDINGISYFCSMYIMNILFINFGIFMLLKYINTKYDFKTAFFSAILVLFFISIFLYTPIFYSDTLSLFVPISLAFVVDLFFRKEKEKEKLLIAVFLGILLFLGKELKLSSTFVFIAFVIKILFEGNIIKYLKYIALSILIFVILSLVFKSIIVYNPSFSFKKNDYGSYPYTHWIMMGLEDPTLKKVNRNSYGGYNLNDYLMTLSYKNGKEASKHNMEEIQRRIKLYSPSEYIVYLNKKSSNAWGDGFYFSNVALTINSEHSGENIYNEITSSKSILYFCQGTQYAFVICLVISSFVDVFKKDKKIDIIKLSIFGLFIFLLFWENRSRYVYNYIPLFICVITSMIYSADDYFTKKKTSKLKI